MALGKGVSWRNLSTTMEGIGRVSKGPGKRMNQDDGNGDGGYFRGSNPVLVQYRFWILEAGVGISEEKCAPISHSGKKSIRRYSLEYLSLNGITRTVFLFAFFKMKTRLEESLKNAIDLSLVSLNERHGLQTISENRLIKQFIKKGLLWVNENNCLPHTLHVVVLSGFL